MYLLHQPIHERACTCICCEIDGMPTRGLFGKQVEWEIPILAINSATVNGNISKDWNLKFQKTETPNTMSVIFIFFI